MQKTKSEIKNPTEFRNNDENMTFVYTFSNLLKINRKSFLKSFNDFRHLIGMNFSLKEKLYFYK